MKLDISKITDNVFEDLIIPEESNLAKALGVKEGQQFKWDNPRYANIVFKITDGFRWVRHASGEWSRPGNEIELCQMIADPSKIKPLPRWTPEEKTISEVCIQILGFEKVHKHKNLTVTLYKGAWGQDIRKDCYPSLQPGECVSLKEIAGGDQ